MTQSGQERRRTKRLPVLDSFGMFVTVAKKELLRLKLYDVSEGGLLFDVEIEGEPEGLFEWKLGEVFKVSFFLNPSLSIPLDVRIQRLDTTNGVRRVGTEIVDRKSKNYQAFSAVVNMLDVISEVAQIRT